MNRSAAIKELARKIYPIIIRNIDEHAGAIRMREEIAQVAYYHFEEKINALQAENARLRQALEKAQEYLRKANPVLSEALNEIINPDALRFGA